MLRRFVVNMWCVSCRARTVYQGLSLQSPLSNAAQHVSASFVKYFVRLAYSLTQTCFKSEFYAPGHSFTQLTAYGGGDV